MNVQIQDVAGAWLSVFEAPPRMTVTEWADRYRYLSPESSAQHGKYSSDQTPYARAWMDSVNDPTATGVVLMVASQLGKTEALNNIVGYFIDVEPSPQLMVQPTIDLGEAWSKERFAGMCRDTPSLQGKVADARSRDSGNTILHKVYPGGNIAVAGANAPSGLASRPRRVVLLDEVDRYPVSAGTEGDPCALAIRRTETYWNAVVVMTSTPTVKGRSRIETEYLQSDQQHLYCRCPKCKAEQTLKWSQVRWDAEDGSDARYECESCKAPLNDSDRKKMVRSGRWVAKYPARSLRGFHLNGLASIFRHKKGFLNRLHQMAAEHIAAKAKGKETLRTWVNTFLAETWEEDGESVPWEPLLARATEDWGEFPEGGLVVTAGIDVQGDRIEIEWVAWGEGESSWSLDYQVLMGDLNNPAVQADLDALLSRTWTHPCGTEIRVTCSFIDSGHKSKSVYAFTRKREARRIYAVKGRGGAGIPLVSRPTRRGIERAALFSVGTDTAKDIIYSRLTVSHHEPGFMHFRKGEVYNETYFRQLTAETKVTRYQNGVPYARFENPSNARNEALDCRVYALAALNLLNVNWKKLAASYRKPDEADQAKPAEAPKRKTAPRRSGWVSNW